MAELKQGVPFIVRGEHTGTDTTEYQLLVNDAIAQVKPVAELKDGKIIEFPHPDGLAPGTYAMRILAVGPDGPADAHPTDSVALAVLKLQRPTSVVNVTVIVQAA